MYRPVKDFFTGLGYTVNAEVVNCDVAMVKDGVLTIVEMKKSLNMTLLYQAVDRLSITSQVYVAIPRPKRIRNRENELARRILAKLGLGLIYVDLSGNGHPVEVACFPFAVVKSPSKKRRDGVLKELAGRSVDVNVGGQTRKPVATAYRERAVKIACLLERHGAQSVKELRALHGCDEKTAHILRNNYYGWFERAVGTTRTQRYGLSADGVAMLSDESAGGAFAALINNYRDLTED